jgi:hypothetical protein
MLFRRKKSHGSAVNANGWMISYADMVTILLAMFIVLSTLSKDQTGLSLYYGTGSYRKAVKQFGLPGVSNNTAKTVQLEAPGPKFAIDDPSDSKKEENDQRVIDGEEEVFQQFLGNAKKDLKVENAGRESGRTSVDFYSRLNSTSPLLSPKQHDMIVPLLLMAQQRGFRVEVVVWAPTPADTACFRSIKTANVLRNELLAELATTKLVEDRIIPVARPWKYRDVRRPIFSIVVSRIEPAKTRQ